MTVHIRGFYCSFIWAPKGSVFKLVYLFIKTFGAFNRWILGKILIHHKITFLGFVIKKIGEKNSMPHFLTGIIFFRSTLKKHKDNVPLGWSVSGSVIQDHLVCSTSREPTILPWRRIHWFIWLVMTQAISDHWSSSGSLQRNTP